MKKNRKRFYQRRVFWVAAGILGVSLIAGGRMAMARQELLARQEALRNGAATAEAAEGTIVSVVSGSGRLLAAENVEITAPTGIKVKTVLVETGDSVKAGDVLAELDPISILSGLTQIEDDIDSIDDTLDDDDEDLTSLKREELRLERRELLEYKEQLLELREHPVIIAAVDGVVDELYLEEAMEISRSQSAGSSGGSSAAVSSAYGSGAGAILPTAYRTTSYVAASDSAAVCSGSREVSAGSQYANRGLSAGSLYANRELSAGSLYANRELSAGSLYANRELSAGSLYVNRDLSAGEKSRAGLLLLGTTEEPDDEPWPDDELIFVDEEPDEEPNVYEDGGEDTDGEEQDIQITDFGAFLIETPRTGGIPQNMLAETDTYAGTIAWSPGDAVFAAATVYTANCVLSAKEGYTFYGVELTGLPGEWFYSVSEDGRTLDVTITYPMTEPDETPEEETDSDVTPTPEQNPADPSDPGAIPGVSPTPELIPSITPSLTPTPTIPATDGAYGSAYASVTATPSVSTASGVSGQIVSGSSGYYSNYETVVCVVRKQDTMKLQVSVDELDILSVAEGQSAAVTIDAIPDRMFEGTISEIADSAESGSGSAKYAVDILLAADEAMRLGMSASAEIEVAKAENILTIPMLALQQSGSQMFVYTEQNDDGSLGGAREVTTGVSDGELVEITEGLTAGETVYYLRSEEDSQGTFFAANSPFGGGRQSGWNANGSQE